MIHWLREWWVTWRVWRSWDAETRDRARNPEPFDETEWVEVDRPE